MIGVAIVIMCVGLGSAVIVIAMAHAYRIVSEARLRTEAFSREFKEVEEKDTAAADLERRLDAFRKERFGRPLVGPPQGLIPPVNRMIPLRSRKPPTSDE